MKPNKTIDFFNKSIKSILKPTYTIFLIQLISTLTFSCSKDPSKKDSEQQNTSYGEVNESFLKSLNFPSTIEKISLNELPTTPESPKTITAPDGMIYIPAGNVRIGSEEGFPHERPMFWASVKPFFMDKSPVTVAQFRKFIEATKYKTEADKFGNAGVILKSTDRQWILKDKANWEYPLGIDFPKAPDNHPVTQVSWNDATAYAQWVGKRLPCEIEWEHAARNGKNTRTIYSWGDNLMENGKYLANVWQGRFPEYNDNIDGFEETSPVGKFGNTPLGLTDMSGNVWEWCSNYKFNYEALFRSTSLPDDVTQEKTERGGSFLCEPTWCHGYRVAGRSSSTAETSLFHVGFRLVKDI